MRIFTCQVAVVEVSSYQLELQGYFRPKVLSTALCFSSFSCLVFILHLHLEPIMSFKLTYFETHLYMVLEIQSTGWKSHMVGSTVTAFDSSHSNV